jgi:hypothetical protein
MYDLTDAIAAIILLIGTIAFVYLYIRHKEDVQEILVVTAKEVFKQLYWKKSDKTWGNDKK